jgi:hypothetical protein
MLETVERGPVGSLTVNCYMIPAVVLQLTRSWIDIDLLCNEHAPTFPLQSHPCNHL